MLYHALGTCIMLQERDMCVCHGYALHADYLANDGSTSFFTQALALAQRVAKVHYKF